MDSGFFAADARFDSEQFWHTRLGYGALQIGRYATRHIGPGVVTMRITREEGDTATIVPGFLPVDQAPAHTLPSALQTEEQVPLLVIGNKDQHYLTTTLEPTTLSTIWRARALQFTTSPLGAALYNALPDIWLYYAEYGRGLPVVSLPAAPDIESSFTVSYLPLSRWFDHELKLPDAIRNDRHVRGRITFFDPQREVVTLVLEEVLGTSKVHPQLVSFALDEDAGAIADYMLRLGSSQLAEHRIPAHRGRWN
jgi:hypothetical protein